MLAGAPGMASIFCVGDVVGGETGVAVAAQKRVVLVRKRLLSEAVTSIDRGVRLPGQWCSCDEGNGVIVRVVGVWVSRGCQSIADAFPGPGRVAGMRIEDCPSQAVDFERKENPAG